MTPAVARLDASVLYPASPRGLLLQRAFAGCCRARWTEEVDEQWKRNVLSARPELAAKIGRTRAVMRRAIADALVTGWNRIAGEIVRA